MIERAILALNLARRAVGADKARVGRLDRVARVVWVRAGALAKAAQRHAPAAPRRPRIQQGGQPVTRRR